MCGTPLSSIPYVALALPGSYFTPLSPQSIVKKKKNPKYGVTKSHQKSLVRKETCENDECRKERDGEYVTLRSQNESSMKCYGKDSTRRYKNLTNPQKSETFLR
ncbi:hypothetical protein Nmel_003908 [Mimus melanotis]